MPRLRGLSIRPAAMIACIVGAGRKSILLGIWLVVELLLCLAYMAPLMLCARDGLRCFVFGLVLSLGFGSVCGRVVFLPTTAAGSSDNAAAGVNSVSSCRILVLCSVSTVTKSTAFRRFANGTESARCSFTPLMRSTRDESGYTTQTRFGRRASYFL